MKKYILASISAMLFMITSPTVFGQVQTVRSVNGEPERVSSIRAKLESAYEGLVDIRQAGDPDRIARAGKAGEAMRNARFGPGDHPVFLLSASHEFIKRGEELKLSLIPIFNSERRFTIFAQLLKPGNNGEYDGTQVIGSFPADNGNYGYVEGLEIVREIKIGSRLFSGEDLQGRYTYSITAWENGLLVQQIFYDVYLVNAGQYGRWFYTKTTRSVDNSYLLTGRFPVNIPIFYYVGTPEAGNTVSGPDPEYAAYSNGTDLLLPVGLTFNRTTSVDIHLWAPYMRYAINRPYASVDDVPVQ